MARRRMMVNISFDPMQLETRKIFLDNFGRSFYLLWKSMHMVGEDFNAICETLMESFHKAKPNTPEELIKIFPTTGGYFARVDVEEFCHMYWDYLIGDSRVGYKQGKVEGITDD